MLGFVHGKLACRVSPCSANAKFIKQRAHTHTHAHTLSVNKYIEHDVQKHNWNQTKKSVKTSQDFYAQMFQKRF